MKKQLKRFFAMALSAVMMLAMGVPAIAADANSTAMAKVTGIKQDGDNVAVTAYKIAELDPTSTTGWKAVDGVAIADIMKPTSTELRAVDVTALTGTAMTKGSVYAVSGINYADYTKDLTAGMYLLKVTGTTVNYNPMVVSISLQGDELNTDHAVVAAKPEDTTVDKAAKDKDGNPANDLAIGDIVDFTVTAIIPQYGEEYEDKTVTYTITDTLSVGLAYTPDSGTVTVTEGQGSVTEGLPTVAVNGQKLTVTFSSEFVKAHPGAVVTFTYSAKLNEKAVTNFNMNRNDVVLEYTNNPGGTTHKVTDKTYHYTFEVDGKAFGATTSKNEEIVKTDTGTETTVEGEATTTYKKLEGAEFKLYTDETCTREFASAVSDSNGLINLKGLDGNVTYWLKETKAPVGYALNSTPVSVLITPEYDADGKLLTYKVAVDGNDAAGYTAVYDKETITTVTPDEGNDSYEFKNTKTSELPSTGGIGTYLFTIVGVIVMAVAALMFFLKRRRREA